MNPDHQPHDPHGRLDRLAYDWPTVLEPDTTQPTTRLLAGVSTPAHTSAAPGHPTRTRTSRAIALLHVPAGHPLRPRPDRYLAVILMHPSVDPQTYSSQITTWLPDPTHPDRTRPLAVRIEQATGTTRTTTDLHGDTTAWTSRPVPAPDLPDLPSPLHILIAAADWPPPDTLTLRPAPLRPYLDTYRTLLTAGPRPHDTPL